ncbi:MAG: hypothetical protein JOS17DRAFT_376415 [Linnemannia elongata]|nr:MAG: hypothetical protein JOS17DRAFT_376415 [Linnemannia elongata]
MMLLCLMMRPTTSKLLLVAAMTFVPLDPMVLFFLSPTSGDQLPVPVSATASTVQIGGGRRRRNECRSHEVAVRAASYWLVVTGRLMRSVPCLFVLVQRCPC